MIPVSPWAIVSWISRAIRCRSSRTPASRAWVSSCAWRPAFSSSAASSRASATRRSSFCSVTFSPNDGAGADRDGLDDDDREVPGPRVGGLREAGDEGVHEDRRRRDADDGERQRPQHRGVEEPGDHEDEEQRLPEHQHRREDQQPDEEDVEPQEMVLVGFRPARVEDVHPDRGAGGDGEGRQPPAEVRVAGADPEERGEGEQHVPAPIEHAVAETLPARPCRRGHDGTLLHRPARGSGSPSRWRCSRSRRRAHSHRKSRTARTPTTIVSRPIPSSGATCGTVPSHASWRPWTPGGVKSPILTRMSGR